MTDTSAKAAQSFKGYFKKRPNDAKSIAGPVTTADVVAPECSSLKPLDGGAWSSGMEESVAEST